MQERKPYVSVKHFNMQLFDHKGEEVQKDKNRIYSIEYTTYQDTVDLLPYFVTDGKLHVVVIESCKPALLLRPSVATPIEGIREVDTGGYILEQPSAVIQNRKSEYSINDTIKRILEEKLPGLVTEGTPTILGGSYFPSVGSSTEIVFPRAILVRNDTSYTHISSRSRAYVMEAQAVIGMYHTQEKLISTRLVELVCRLADKHNYPLRIPLQAVDIKNYSKEEVLHKERFISKDILRGVMEDEIPEGSLISKVTLMEVEKPQIPFLLTTHFRTEVTQTDGSKVHEEVDVLIRKNIDSIDVGGYFAVDGILYMPIKWGIRPSLAVRNLMPHPIHTDVSMYFIEGIAGSLEAEKTSVELFNRGALESQEEVSLAQALPSVYLGYDTPSPGHNPERVYRIMLPLDPTYEVARDHNEEETTRIAYVGVEDIIALAHEGIIRDPRLSLNAHFLKMLYQDTDYKVPQLVVQQEDVLFEELVNRPSEVQQWLSKTSSHVDAILSESSLYRKLKIYGENELGVAVMSLTHDKEAHFFSPMVPLFAMPSSNQEDKLPFYYLHDLFHYATTGFIPLFRNNEKTTICSLDEYIRAVTGNECEAVWYSDVLIPEEFGVDRAEQIFNGDSVARAFAELSIDKDAAREIIREIELEGKIRDEVKHHPLFKRFRGVFIGRLLRYHVMDKDNCTSMYAYWQDHLDIAEMMEDFCDVFSSVEAYEAYYRNTVTHIVTYTEGMNPLRAYLSKLLNVDLRLLALKLAYVRHEARIQQVEEVEETIAKLLGEMKIAYKEVYAKRAVLTNIDPTEKNKSIITRAHAIKQGIVKDAENYLESLAENPKLNEEVRSALKNRIVPFFEPFRDIDPQFLSEELSRLQQENNLF